MSVRRILVLGATSGIAQGCIQRWAAQGNVEFVLLGRDLARVQAIADDLSVRHPNAKAITRQSASSPAEISALVSDVWGEGIDVALIAQGSLPEQQEIQGDLAAVQREFETNAVVPALYVEALASRMQGRGAGRLAVISSVAGDRGRASNYIYGSAKAGLSAFTEGVWHRLGRSKVTVTLVKPGPTATPMTQHLVDQGQRLASVDSVAKAIVRGTDRGKAVVYAPGKWRVIMSIVRSIPRPIFRRLPM